MQSISSLKFLKPYLKQQKIQLIIMFLALIVTSSSVLIFSRYLSYMIDHFFSHSMNPDFLKFFLYQNLLILILAIGTAMRYYFTTSIGENIVLSIKKDLFSHLLNLSPSFFETEKPGNLISQIQNDTQIIQNLIGSNISVALRNLIMFLGGLVMLIAMSSKLTLFIAILIPIILIPIIIFGKKIKKLSRKSQEQQGVLTSLSEEAINSIKTIQSYSAEEYEKKKYESSLKLSLQTSMNLAKSKSALIFIVIFLVFCGVGLILWYGGYDVVSGKMTIGELSSFIFLAIICAGSIGGLSETFGEIIKSAAACERAAEFLNLRSEIRNSANSITIDKEVLQSLHIKDVNFSYPSKKTILVLDNLNFTIHKNEKVAIVGKSGAGKSTILELIIRFYDINSGDILFNEHSIKNININSLRGKIAYIPQDPVIFSSTIYENILFGNPNSSYDQAIQAAKLAAVDEFANNLPEGYYTFIGQKGVRLSGGQKQRVALARAILRNPEILLLDEATSSLDYKNEKLIQEAINNISRDKMTDLAILKIDANSSIPYVKFGDSDKVRVGEPVIAIGNAFGFGGTVTAGIISAKGRYLGGQFYEEFIQTDASINKGNSGGPMFNMNGEVIGVNSAIVSPSGGNVGIGFAIPSNTAKSIINKLLKDGKIERPWLGITFQPVTEDMVKGFNLDNANGAIVSNIMKDSPAEKAGINIGDIIIKFNGKVLNNINQFPRIVADSSLNTKIPVEIIRKGKKINTNVTLEIPKNDPFNQDGEEVAVETTYHGIGVVNLTKDVRNSYAIGDDINGVLVTKVDKNCDAYRKGLKVGDVISSINQDEVTSAKQFRTLLTNIKLKAKNGDAKAVVLVARKNSNFYITIELS